MFNVKKMTGMTSKTPEHLLLGAGVFAKNFVVGTDTYESAKTAGKLIGATTGGGEFKATKNGHYCPVDGVPENTAGLWLLDNWTTTLKATLREVTADGVKLALAASKVVTDANIEGYEVIEPKGALEAEDYADNITYIGRISGNSKPVIIQVYKAFNTNDFTVTPVEGDEASVQVIFTGHYEADDTTTELKAPFRVFYPTAEA